MSKITLKHIYKARKMKENGIFIWLMCSGMAVRGEVFSIKTEGCTIPHKEDDFTFIPPDPMVTACPNTIELVTHNNTHLSVDEQLLTYFNVWRYDFFYCCYKNFSLNVNQNIKHDIRYDECKVFNETIVILNEFVKIECYYDDSKIYQRYLLFDVHSRRNREGGNWRTLSNGYNVIIIGFESMSRGNFIRTMPASTEFIRERGLEFVGYNKIGDNSYPNLFPLLTGKSFTYARNTCRKKKCTFLWDLFRKHGFETALGSDETAGLIGAFEYSLPITPTDYYLQPFIQEARRTFTNGEYSYHLCMGNTYLYNILLGYIESVLKAPRNKHLFGLFWEESVSHDHLNYPAIMDNDLLFKLSEFEQQGLMNNTIMIFLSDHGMRWGADKDIMRTYQGHLEERLPVLFILFPLSFRQRFKLAYKNAMENSKRLITAYDIYKTLVDLTSLDELSDTRLLKRKYNSDDPASLFVPIPESRTCSDAGIAEHWCACYQGTKKSVVSKTRDEAGRFLVNYLNSLLVGYPECNHLKLSRVLDCNVVVKNTTKSRMDLYTIVVRTKPGGGFFEATLVRQGGLWALSGTVSRLNRYGDQSACIDDYLIKMYCYCLPRNNASKH